MKTCTVCKQEKDLSMFNKNKNKKDGYQTLCRECSNARSRKYYTDNIEHHKKETNRRRKEYKKLAQAYVRKLKESTPCADCGSFYPWPVMDFDHQREKVEDVSRLVNNGSSLNTIKDEIDKCEIVCANCHRMRSLGHLT